MSARIPIPPKLKDIFGQAQSLKDHISIKSLLAKFTSRWTNRISIDSFVFSLHSTITVAMLVFFMGFLSMKQYFGEVIECLDIATAPQSLNRQQMTNYCWMEGAFTIVTRLTEAARRQNAYEVTGHDTAYPGIRAYKPHQGDLKMPHKYYQWVYYILAIQCFMFYAPKLVWRLRERGRLTQLITKLQEKRIVQILYANEYQQILPEMERHQMSPPEPGMHAPPATLNEMGHLEANEAIQDIADTILIADQYYYGIIKAETIYLIHLACEFVFIHLFLGGKFLWLGFQWLHYTALSDDIALDPLIRIFPRLTKCSFHKFGASGSLETFDTLCFMPMNIVNEKIFVILWFWFVLLFLLTSWHLTFNRGINHLSRACRLRRLKKLAPCADLDNSTPKEAEFLETMSNTAPGRSFILQSIAKNLKPNHFRYYLEQTSRHFKKANDNKLLVFTYKSRRPLGFEPLAPMASDE